MFFSINSVRKWSYSLQTNEHLKETQRPRTETLSLCWYCHRLLGAQFSNINCRSGVIQYLSADKCTATIKHSWREQQTKNEAVSTSSNRWLWKLEGGGKRMPVIKSAQTKSAGFKQTYQKLKSLFFLGFMKTSSHCHQFRRQNCPKKLVINSFKAKKKKNIWNLDIFLQSYRETENLSFNIKIQ